MEIRELGGQALLEKLNSGEISILKMLNADDMRREMVPIGKICAFAVNSVYNSGGNAKKKERAIKLVNAVMPYRLTAPFPVPADDEGMVIGFNHPSLGEIIRMLSLGVTTYTDREFLFPVNLPWYESLVPILPRVKALRINITPMITPSTEKKLLERNKGSEEAVKDISFVKNYMERTYMKTARSFAENRGIIVLAPSATRQAEVIVPDMHPTMTLLAHMALRNKETKAMFLPVAVIEPKRNDRRMNLFKRYDLTPCEPFSADEVRELTDKSREFDIIFLKRIEEVYKKAKAERGE